MRGARGLLLAVLLCLAGASAVLGSAGRVWVRSESRVQTPTAERPDAFVTTTQTRDADDVAGGTRALGVVALAGTAALVAARGRGRALVGLALLGTGGAIAGLALGVDGTGVTRAPAVAVVGGVAVGVAGSLAIAAGAAWPGLGARYEAPVADDRRDQLGEAWDAVERGDDLA